MAKFDVLINKINAKEDITLEEVDFSAITTHVNTASVRGTGVKNALKVTTIVVGKMMARINELEEKIAQIIYDEPELEGALEEGIETKPMTAGGELATDGSRGVSIEPSITKVEFTSEPEPEPTVGPKCMSYRELQSYAADEYGLKVVGKSKKTILEMIAENEAGAKSETEPEEAIKVSVAKTDKSPE